MSAAVGGEDLIDAVKKMKKREREAFLGDLLATTSPDPVKSVRETRADKQAGRVKIHVEVFGVKSARCKTPELRFSEMMRRLKRAGFV